jgi:hypothetical protein
MIFPKSTEFNKKIPKERFYKNIDASNKIKERFKKEIKNIYLKNKISKDTINIPGTKNVEEIFVFSIKLKDDSYFEKIENLLLLIDRAIPYPILYEFNLEEETKYKIAYKEKNKVFDNDSVVDIYLTGEPDKKSEKTLLNSINLEILYGKIIRAIIGIRSKKALRELIQVYKLKKSLELEISALEKKVKKEKQPDRQFELLNNIGSKKKELSKIKEKF